MRRLSSSDALSADNLRLLRPLSDYRCPCGLFASFMPKPILECPQWMHVNISLVKNGLNIFKNIVEGHSNAQKALLREYSQNAGNNHFLNPLATIQRFGKFEAPAYVSWSHENRSQLINSPLGKRSDGTAFSDPSINPYLRLRSLLRQEWREWKRYPAAAADVDLYTAEKT